jgi:tight adherence protein B
MNALWASAACAGGFTYVLIAPHPRQRLVDRRVGRMPARGRGRLVFSVSWPVPMLAWGALAGLAGMAAVATTGSAVLGLVVPPVVGVLARGHHARSRRSAVERTRGDVVEFCTALAAELRTGVPPPDALGYAAAVPAAHVVIAPHALRAARSGGEVAQALRRDAQTPGAEGLRALSACWEVAMGSGAAMSPALRRLVRGLRSEQAQRREIAATLAAPRATARLLAWLPGAGILMGTGLGADPLGLLLGTPVGAVLLVTGTALALLGLVWTDLLARAADPATRGPGHETLLERRSP